MNEQDQIKALAELDGWIDIKEDTDGTVTGLSPNAQKRHADYRLPLLFYTFYYDAIIPLRVKICNSPALKVAWLNHARNIIARRADKSVSDFDIASIKPDEDCEALLRATGKWKE